MILNGTNGETKVGALDMADGNDRTLLRAKRWNTSDEQRARYLKALDIALHQALSEKDQRAIVSCVKTIAMLEGQNQADEHMDEKNKRIDGGQATDALKVVYEDEQSVRMQALHRP